MLMEQLGPSQSITSFVDATVEWGLAPLVARMNIGATVEQHLYNFELPVSGC